MRQAISQKSRGPLPRIAPCAGGCGGRVTASSKTGFCQACWGRRQLAAMRDDPEIAAKVEAARRDPAAIRRRAAANSGPGWGRVSALDAEAKRTYRKLRRHGVPRGEALLAVGATT